MPAISDAKQRRLVGTNGYYGTLFQVLCLMSLLFAPLMGAAKGAVKGGAKAHPFRKVDTTPNGQDGDVWTLTLESDTYLQTSYLSSILGFSSRNGWDIQIASYNIPVYGGGAQNYEWDSYINLSKTFEISRQFKAIVGSQNGTTLFSTSRQYHNIDYGLLAYLPTQSINLHAGPYWANKALTATTDYLGYTVGFSLDLIKDTITLQADFFSGSNNASGAVINLNYQVLPKAQIYIGAGIPTPNSGNQFYGIVGFTLSSR
jgi:hypothetical protein